jgi:hypothetical protein
MVDGLRIHSASRAVIVPTAVFRPKSAMNGKRIGEAAHPGPSEDPLSNSNSSSLNSSSESFEPQNIFPRRSFESAAGGPLDRQ